MTETIIYNWRNQQAEYVGSELMLILIILGLIGYVIHKYKNKERHFINLLLSLGQNDFVERILSKVFMFFSAIGLIIISYQNIKEYLYVNHIDKLEEIQEISGVIDNLKYLQRVRDTYSFTVNETDFKIYRKSKYISSRDLIEKDFVRIEYFEMKPKHGPNKNVVVKLTLIE